MNLPVEHWPEVTARDIWHGSRAIRVVCVQWTRRAERVVSFGSTFLSNTPHHPHLPAGSLTRRLDHTTGIDLHRLALAG